MFYLNLTLLNRHPERLITKQQTNDETKKATSKRRRRRRNSWDRMQLAKREMLNRKHKQRHSFGPNFSDPNKLTSHTSSAFVACAFSFVFPTQLIRTYEKYRCVFKLDMLSARAPMKKKQREREREWSK